MSAIVGLYHRDGQPVEPETLAGMMEPMADWGPDGKSAWIDGPVALGQLSRFNTPEARLETLPLTDESGACTLVAAARLDNREELFAALNVPLADRRTTPGGALILRAYLKWGEECPDRLEGDWSFAVWDARRRSLFLARDPHGMCGLYWYESPTRFAFATSLKGLLALPGVPQELNPLPVARMLIQWQEESEETYYRGISRLPPAHHLRVTENRLDYRRYWRLEDAPEIRFPSDEATLEAFLDLYSRAVRDRLRSDKPVCATLSAGLDSGSVCALAARELSKSGRTLAALTSVPLYPLEAPLGPNILPDESAMARQVVDYCGIERHLLTHAENVTPMKGVRRSLTLHDEPFIFAANRYWILSLLQMAQEHGQGTVLTGQYGNGSISYGRSLSLPPDSQGFLARCRYLSRHKGLHATLKTQILDPMRERIRTRLQSVRGEEPDWLRYSAINRDFARRIQLRELRRQRFGDFERNYYSSREERCLILQPGKSRAGDVWNQMGAAFDLDVRDPTGDRRLLEFCFGLPDDQFYCEGETRRLIRTAMKGLLPESIRLNRQYGFQSSDLVLRVLTHPDEVETALARAEASRLAGELLDLPKMKESFQQLRQGSALNSLRECSAVLIRGLTMSEFLCRVESPNHG